ncbi:hypothetical protein M513_04625 [Trichuris suis]|uniref:Reverse transcriptase domain-containing protein n=1 Tax=Trichuris suis TaxID=68888 RepID=A0A085MB82_9BILA|nr:hypothetical protein M513_04625 [Trichuris suis]
MNRILDSSIYCSLGSHPTDHTRKALRSLLLDYTRESKEEKLSLLANHLKFSSTFKCPQMTSPHILVSNDVKDLFTSIPTAYTLNIVHELLYTDRTIPERAKLSLFQIVQLVSFCMLEGNFFQFRGRYFGQKGSSAKMGSPLSPVLAEVFMEHLEDQAFSKADHSTLPHALKRYVDDIFVVIESRRDFLNFLNALFPNIISFTIEKEVCGRLPFLDFLVMRTSEGLKTRVYRKPTHSDR